MDVSRNFLLIGVVYLVIGIGLGMYMGGSGDHSLTPVHAHINLLGFTLMTVFGLVYRVIPAMAASPLARVHFWIYQVGALLLLLMLFLFMSGRITEAAMLPWAPLAELCVLVGVLTFGFNLLRNGR